MSFEVIVLGIGNAFSTEHHPASLLLRKDGFYLAIDCPDRYGTVLKDISRKVGSELRLSDINDFIITHVHGDHMAGLELTGFIKVFKEGFR